MGRFFILLFFFGIAASLSAQMVRDVQITGCKKTKNNYLKRFLCIEKGEVIDSAKMRLDEQVLRNLDLFAEVTPVVRDTLGGCIIEYQLKERISLIPIGKFGAAGGNLILQLGVVDYNFRGNGGVASAYYKYYDRHTFHTFIRTPFVRDSDWGWSGSLLKQSTLEPINFDTQRLDYKYDMYAFELLARYSFSFTNFMEFGGAALYERYAPDGYYLVLPEGAISISTPKLLTKFSHTLNKVDFFNEYRDGFYNNIGVEASTAPELTNKIFWKIKNTSAYYRRIGKSGNLALRLNVGISTNDYTPFPAFVLDNYINVRGVGDRVLRGSRELSFNAEYRQTVFERKIGMIQLVPFLDVGALGASGEAFSDIAKPENRAIFGGLGIRLSVRQISNLIIRLDFSTDVTSPETLGFGFGLGQFF